MYTYVYTEHTYTYILKQNTFLNKTYEKGFSEFYKHMRLTTSLHGSLTWPDHFFGTGHTIYTVIFEGRKVRGFAVRLATVNF